MSAAPATARIATPIGMVELVAVGSVLTSARIRPKLVEERQDPGNPVLDRAVDQMRDYFAGRRKAFDLPLAKSATGEAEHLRAAIASIPYGDTETYGALARKAGSVARAVGQACKTNPFPIVIPCHRVVSSAGREYYSAGAGPETKAWLIDFEAEHSHGIRTRLL